MNITQAKYNEARTIAQILDKRVRMLRYQGIALVSDVILSTRMNKLLDSMASDLERELEDMAHRYEGQGIGEYTQEDHEQIGF